MNKEYNLTIVLKRLRFRGEDDEEFLLAEFYPIKSSLLFPAISRPG